MKEATLDDFLDRTDVDEDGAEADGAVGPAATTYAWGIDCTCDTCGVSAERFWRADDALVCSDCKRW